MEEILNVFVHSALVDNLCNEGRPESIEEIDQYEWITTDGHLAVMFDGLPRYLA